MAQTWTWRDGGEPLHISLAAGTLTLSFGGHTNLSFDGEGRLVGAWYKGQTYRRALDNRILYKWSDDGSRPRRQRRFLTTDEAARLVDQAYGDARRAYEGLIRDQLIPPAGEPPLADFVPWLETVAQWDFDALEEDAARFHTIYKPISILPPDQYLSLVLQATEGCSYNECTFCTFYRDRRFRIKSAGEFADHVEQVRRFMGRGVFLRRSIFLADANAIVIRQDGLLPLLDVVNGAFRFDGAGGVSATTTAPPAVHASPGDWTPTSIHAFVSAPDALRKSVDELRELAHRNVRRLYVGLESGHDPLRDFLRKPGTARDVLDAVVSMKRAGIHVGLIFMAGVGGDEFRDAHLRDTVDLIRRMPLGAGDLVYVSPFVAAPESPYLDDMQRAGYSSLGETAIRIEEERFRSELLPWLKQRGVRMSRYDIREFVY